MRTIVWFRGKDLRLADHVPLLDALEAGETLPLFVLDPAFFAPERAARHPHRIQFLLESLAELACSIEQRGSRLLLATGKSHEVVPALFDQWRADRVVAHSWVVPFGRERDRRVAAALGDRLQLYPGETLLPPGSLRTGEGRPYAVFTPFARAFRRAAGALAPARRAPEVLRPLPAGLKLEGASLPTCEDLGIRPNPALQAGGERAARARLERFVAGAAGRYDLRRDRMDDEGGTSRLSADLKFGTLSVREVWHTVTSRVPAGQAVDTFLNELLWREFAHSTLWDRPELLREPFRPAWSDFPYRTDERAFESWAHGRTGYPLVDAAARQLLREGFVHNRARMIAASFLTKHLLIDYRLGEAHYMRYLTDGDWAQNNMGWQWSAGCGCDAQPYFRVFNPVTQGQKFDPTGAYVRRQVPELARVPERFVHSPWEAPAGVLADAGVRLGDNYPHPIIDHRLARERFLAAAQTHLKP